MTLEQLRIFVAVAQREHMTRAADALNLTQSAASGAIAALEARHDVKLFNRVGRGIELTDAGRMFLRKRAVLARAAGAEQALADYAGLRRGTLRLVASQTIAGYWLPSVWRCFTGATLPSNSRSPLPIHRAPRALFMRARRNWALSRAPLTIPLWHNGRWGKTGW
jgi:DNA-binding MarR family transcriptional regulator